MKKIFFLVIVAVLFASCEKDDPVNDPWEWQGNWNNSGDPSYKPEYGGKYNPIKGEWIVTHRNGEKVSDDEYTIYQFTYNFIWDEATEKPDPDLRPKYNGKSRYAINGTTILDLKDVVHRYTVDSAKQMLTLDDRTTKLILRPYVSTAWEWKGDWNDKTSPDYPQFDIKHYPVGYNPIAGTWCVTHIGGDTLGVTPFYYRFNYNFTVEESYYPEKYYRNERKYEINDIGVWENEYGSFSQRTYRYRIEGSKLYYRMMRPSAGSDFILERY